MTCVGYMCGRQREGLENGKTDFFVCLFCLFDVLDMAKNDVDTMDDDAIERALLVEEEKKKEEEAREDAGLKEMEREMQQKLALAIQEAETKRQGKEEEYNRQLKLANDKANAKIAALEAREREMIEKEKEMKRKMEAESKKNEEKTKLLSEREKLMDILSKGREGTWWLVVGWFFTVVDELTFFPFSPFPLFPLSPLYFHLSSVLCWLITTPKRHKSKGTWMAPFACLSTIESTPSLPTTMALPPPMPTNPPRCMAFVPFPSTTSPCTPRTKWNSAKDLAPRAGTSPWPRYGRLGLPLPPTCKWSQLPAAVPPCTSLLLGTEGGTTRCNTTLPTVPW
jgi:hypothetical protein